MGLIRKIKYIFIYAYQKLTRGFTDKDIWNLDFTIARFVLPRLIAYKKIQCGHPMIEGREEDGEEAWNEILDKMCRAFYLVLDDDEELFDAFPGEPVLSKTESGGLDIKFSKEFREMEEKRYKEREEGLQLFGKYFLALWD